MKNNHISASYHDSLEAWSFADTACDIVYRKDGKELTVHSKIVGVLNVKDGEYLFGENGLAIPMDKLVSINGVPFKKQ
ncbi:hypothetical protein [Echinicola vietnamensis]|uniref:Uncharacterized protein n=1 Tax=Echinicola vietnamensis (strain DSM 17526 / LMG 23754 / KMM 6221) TaxID=926556 RepID=L0FVD9_ECHVK|nr:hypothetical protein [Echinicola vietnamensis]AGA76988.1 hypothetical protein Echvi_0711 [Echinicola vietnamensis DSM 17526]